MSEKKCKSKYDFQGLPMVIGGIVVYELAVIIVLLVLILIDFDESLSKKPLSITTEPEETGSEA